MSAYTYLAEHAAHLDGATIAAARKVNATDPTDPTDPRAAAVLRLAAAVNDSRGSLSAETLDATRATGVTGVTDEEIAETIGLVALNVLINYFNKAAGVEVDFPIVTA